MKALAISVQRLGDIVMGTPVYEELIRRGYETHVLINQQFEGIRSLLNSKIRIHTLDRKAIEHSLVEPSAPVFEGYDRLRQLVRRLNRENFDLVVNLTHSQLGGRLTALVDADETIGLCIDGDGRPRFGSSWIRYLNSAGGYGGITDFHISDIYQFALGAQRGAGRYFLQPSSYGDSTWESFRASARDYVLIQPFSSEESKQWSRHSLCQLVLDLERRFPDLDFFFMGAPFEANMLAELQKQHIESGGRCHTAILELEPALSAVQGARLLITPDTAIKHFAAATGTKVLEIALGSSDPSKSGVYSGEQWIVRSLQECSPCKPSAGCSQSSHLCSEDILPQFVADLAEHILQNQSDSEIKKLVSKNSSVEVLKTRISKAGFWSVRKVGADFRAAEFLHENLNRMASKLSLSLPPNEIWQEMGSHGLRFSRSLQDEIKDFNLRDALPEVEKQLIERQSHIRNLQFQFDNRKRQDSAQLKQPAIHDHFTQVRSIQMTLQDLELKNNIQIKLIRQLMTTSQGFL